MDFEKDLLDFLFGKIVRSKKEVSFEQIKKYSQRRRQKADEFFKDFKEKALEQTVKQGFLELKGHQMAKSFIKQRGFILVLT